jgi:ketosteroid isomerase-like protein
VSANVELLRSLMPDEGIDFVRMVNSPDPAGLFSTAPMEVIAPDIEVVFGEGEAGGPGRGKGVQELLDRWRDWLLPYHSYLVIPEEYVDAGEQVVMHVRVSARTERDGVAIEHRPSSVWTVKDGRIVAVRFILDRDEALAFAGVAREQVEGER